MDISSLLSDALAWGAATKIANALGIDNAAAQKLIAIGAPALLNQMHKNAQTPEGAEALSKALDKHPKTKTVDTLTSAEWQTEGKKIVDHILWDQSDATTADIAAKAGVSTTQASGLLSGLAPLLMWALGEQKATNGLDTSDIVGLIEKTATGTSQSGLMNSLATSFLDKNGDGNIKDDILNMWMNWLKGKISA